jgi:hypothetical protein
MVDEPPPTPIYGRYDTIVFSSEDRQVAWLKGVAIWPSVGSVIELGNPNRDAIVTEVRLQLPQAHRSGNPDPGPATILVIVDDPGDEGTIPRRRIGDDLLEGLLDDGS